jgi:hypothetical protein
MTLGSQEIWAIASRPDGSFVVSWGAWVDSGPWSIFARRFDAGGAPLDIEDIPVEQNAGSQRGFDSGVAALQDGSFVVGFTGWDRHYEGILIRRYASDGKLLDPIAVPINVTTGGAQYNASLQSLPDGETVAIVWSGHGPGDTGGVFFNRLRVAGTPVARDDTATASQPGTPIIIHVLLNDADPDVGDTLTVTTATATHGTVVINPDGTLTYSPPAGCGVTSDTISYTITDSTAKTASATVAVTIRQTAIMAVTPDTPTRVCGGVGGPFPAPHGTYTVANDGCAPLPFAVVADDAWVGRAPATGTLAPGASQSVTVRPGLGARALAAGTYTSRVRFRNLTDRTGNTARAVTLNVVPGFGVNVFADAAPLSGPSGVTWSSNVGRTGEIGEPDHAGASLPLASVWWTWTAPSSGKVAFQTAGSSFDTTLAAYTGTAVNALTLVAANDDFGSLAPQSRVSFTAIAGTTYRIAVDGKGSAEGLVRLTWVMP